MKKIFYVPFVAMFAVVSFVACIKDDTPTCTNNTTAQDQHVIDSFIADEGYTTIDYSTTYNLYEGVLSAGNGNTPAGDSIISFDVVSRLLNGTVLDSVRYPVTSSGSTIRYSDLNTSGNNFYSPLLHSNFASMGEGGLLRTIRLSNTWAGCAGATLPNGKVIPANAQIIFDYRLVSVQNGQTN